MTFSQNVLVNTIPPHTLSYAGYSQGREGGKEAKKQVEEKKKKKDASNVEVLPCLASYGRG